MITAEIRKTEYLDDLEAWDYYPNLRRILEEAGKVVDLSVKVGETSSKFGKEGFFPKVYVTGLGEVTLVEYHSSGGKHVGRSTPEGYEEVLLRKNQADRKYLDGIYVIKVADPDGYGVRALRLEEASGESFLRAVLLLKREEIEARRNQLFLEEEKLGKF